MFIELNVKVESNNKTVVVQARKATIHANLSEYRDQYELVTDALTAFEKEHWWNKPTHNWVKVSGSQVLPCFHEYSAAVTAWVETVGL